MPPTRDTTCESVREERTPRATRQIRKLVVAYRGSLDVSKAPVNALSCRADLTRLSAMTQLELA